MLSAQAERKGAEDIAIGDDEKHEVFKKTVDGVRFRTVKWPVAAIIFLKREFDRTGSQHATRLTPDLRSHVRPWCPQHPGCNVQSWYGPEKVLSPIFYVLTVPGTLGGALSVIGWGALNTC